MIILGNDNDLLKEGNIAIFTELDTLTKEEQEALGNGTEEQS